MTLKTILKSLFWLENIAIYMLRLCLMSFHARIQKVFFQRRSNFANVVVCFFVDSEIQIPLNVFAHFLVKADALTTIFKLQLYAHCHLALNNHPDDQAARINAYYSLRHRLGQGCISFVIRYTFPPLS